MLATCLASIHLRDSSPFALPPNIIWSIILDALSSPNASINALRIKSSELSPIEESS